MPPNEAGRVPSLRRVTVELRQDGRGPVLVAIAAGWLLSLGVRMVYPAVLPQLRGAYGLDLTTAGLLISALWAAYALGQLPGGLLDDRFGGGRILVVSTAVSAAAIALVVTAGSVVVLFGATLLFGLATALYGVARFTILTTIYEHRSGTAIALTLAAGDLGNALLPPLAGFLAVAVAWEAGLGVAIPLFLLAAVGIYRLVPGSVRGSDEPETGTGSIGDTGRRIGATMRDRSLVLVFAVQTMSYAIWQGFTGLYPTYLVEVKGLAPATATTMFGGFFGLGMAVKLLAGSAYDTYGLRRSLAVVLLAVSVSMVVVSLAESLPALVVGTALASSVLGFGTITIPYLTEAFPTDIRGTGLGTLRTSYMLLGTASPTVVGVLADAGYFDEAFVLMGGVSAVTVVLALLVDER